MRTACWIAVTVTAVVMIAFGCSGQLPLSAAPVKCGDQCATLGCPAGSHCLLAGNCTPHCELEGLSRFK